MSDKHQVLVIGAGSIGERHVRCFQHTQRAELLLCEINPELRATIADRYKLNRAFGDLDAALAAGPTAAVVCTPAPWHISIATQLAAAGVHLLIEKPLSTTLDGIEPLQDMIARQQLTAAVAYVYRSHPALSAMKQALDTGRFGRPVQVVARCGQHFPYFRPAYRQIYYKDRATGGGAIQDALTHIINAAEWLVGPVDRLAADAAHQVLDGVTVEDTVGVLTRHGSVLGCYSLNQHQAASETELSVICERGIARFEAHQNRWRWAIAPEQPWTDEPGPPLERDDLFTAQAHFFLDAVEGHAPPRCTLADGLQTLRVNLAILAAVETQSWQTV